MKRILFVLVCAIACLILLPLCLDSVSSSVLFPTESSTKKSSTTKITDTSQSTSVNDSFSLLFPTVPPEKNECAVTISIYNAKTNETELILLEDYIVGVMLCEMPASFDIQAIKACAVAARTYTLYRIINGSDQKHLAASVCTDWSHCQGYISYEEACEKWSYELVEKIYPKIKSAVYDTAGIIITSKGAICDAVYHASSSGYTESARNLWGYDIPYLKSVATPENEQNTDNFKREFSFSAEKFKDILKADSFSGIFSSDSEKWLGKTEYNACGRVAYVEISGIKMSGASLRRAFGLSSTVFSVRYENGNIVFSCQGFGHGAGLSQCGANVLAKNGWGYADILCHYYTGVSFGYVSDFMQ